MTCAKVHRDHGSHPAGGPAPGVRRWWI